ncbi:MAG: phosphotransferase [Magnetococcales bacterium]|nr:phosphotransferase [Magnetococcales bacterium]
MGVIKKVLYRGQILGRPRHRNLFLDMEENIHIHYRDLRIELSRGEFEEISETFRKQSAELQTIIHQKGYQDGKLANANQEDVRIWTESQLKHEVTYHPRRLSIEACSDGYHLHYRNYKILIDEEDFRALIREVGRLDPDAPCASTYAEVLELLEANELDFILESGNAPAETMTLRVAAHHLPKVRDIFKLIGFTHEATPEGSLYQGNPLKVMVRGEKKGSGLDFRALRGLNHTERLVEFLSRHGAGVDPNLLNRVKCQVLDLYYALVAGKPAQVECDPQFWLYSPANGRVIFPHSSAAAAGPEAAKSLYRAWSTLLARLEMGFIKPTKIRFEPEAQQALQQRVAETLRAEVASRAAVDRVYLMGSALRGEMGHYLAPFVHGPNAKLGSDVDILIEIHPEREADLPANWHLINPESASSGCAVYHITQIPLAQDVSDWSALHPHLPFMHHLVDAYIHFPSKGNREAKDAFLKKFNARLIHDRLKDGIAPGAEGPLLALTRQVRERYAMPDAVVEPMRVSTENLLYKVFRGENETILKLFKVAGNYHSNRIVEHTAYEASLIEALVARGVETARILPTQPGSPLTLDGHPALLFERIPGLPQSRPEYPLDKIGAALAKLHRVQVDDPVPLPQAFTFEESCRIWLPYFATFQANPTLTPELQAAFAQLAPRIQPFLDESFRQNMHAGCHPVHNHGDVTPKNVIITPTGTTCFFDFNNCYHGPRVLDLLDGGFEFSLADKYIQMADFARFDALLTHYTAHFPLNEAETRTLPDWILLLGIIKFIKEIRVWVERPNEALRRQRALAIAGFLASRNADSPGE